MLVWINVFFNVSIDLFLDVGWSILIGLPVYSSVCIANKLYLLHIFYSGNLIPRSLRDSNFKLLCYMKAENIDNKIDHVSDYQRLVCKMYKVINQPVLNKSTCVCNGGSYCTVSVFHSSGQTSNWHLKPESLHNSSIPNKAAGCRSILIKWHTHLPGHAVHRSAVNKEFMAVAWICTAWSLWSSDSFGCLRGVLDHNNPKTYVLQQAVTMAGMYCFALQCGIHTDVAMATNQSIQRCYVLLSPMRDHTIHARIPTGFLWQMWKDQYTQQNVVSLYWKPSPFPSLQLSIETTFGSLMVLHLASTVYSKARGMERQISPLGLQESLSWNVHIQNTVMQLYTNSSLTHESQLVCCI